MSPHPATPPVAQPYPYAIAVRVSEASLDSLLEQVAAGGSGAYKDEHPWIVARRLLEHAQQQGQQLPLLLAAGDEPEFRHWTFITELDLVELHRSSWQTRAAFGELTPVHPIFTAVDSVFMKPSDEQLQREELEGIAQHRQALTLSELHPYAICETPAYIQEVLRSAAES